MVQPKKVWVLGKAKGPAIEGARELLVEVNNSDFLARVSPQVAAGLISWSGGLDGVQIEKVVDDPDISPWVFDVIIRAR